MSRGFFAISTASFALGLPGTSCFLPFLSSLLLRRRLKALGAAHRRSCILASDSRNHITARGWGAGCCARLSFALPCCLASKRVIGGLAGGWRGGCARLLPALGETGCAMGRRRARVSRAPTQNPRPDAALGWVNGGSRRRWLRRRRRWLATWRCG